MVESKRIIRSRSSTALQLSFAVGMDEPMRTGMQAITLSPYTPYAAVGRLDSFASFPAFPDMLTVTTSFRSLRTLAGMAKSGAYRISQQFW